MQFVKKKITNYEQFFLSDFVLTNWVRLSVYIYLKNTVRFGLASLGTRGHTHRYS